MTLSGRWITVAAVAAACAAGLGGAAGGASSKSSAPSTYKGKTNNGLPVTFRITGGKVRNFSATVHALCVSVLSPGTSHLDPVFHRITPLPMKLSSAGKFSADYRIKTNGTHAKIDGKLRGKTASGRYSLVYNKTDGATSSGVLIIYACQEKHLEDRAPLSNRAYRRAAPSAPARPESGRVDETRTSTTLASVRRRPMNCAAPVSRYG